MTIRGTIRRFVLIAAMTASGIVASPLPAATAISGLRPARTARVTIRGSGNAITIERSGGPAPLPRAAEPSPTVLAQAVGMKESGTSDEALVGFLAAHRAELPALVDFDTVSALRDAGAGRTVIAYLSSVAAVEVGPTGAEGGSRDEPPLGARSAEAEMTNELPAPLAWGGIAIGPPSRGFRRHGFGRRGGPALPGTMGRPGFAVPRPGRVRPR